MHDALDASPSLQDAGQGSGSTSEIERSWKLTRYVFETIEQTLRRFSDQKVMCHRRSCGPVAMRADGRTIENHGEARNFGIHSFYMARGEASLKRAFGNWRFI